MRLLFLFLWIIGALTSKAQWENMPIGTRIRYNCSYTFIHTNRSNEFEDSTRGKMTILLKIDTIVKFENSDRKVILFSNYFDPSGMDYVMAPKKYYKPINEDIKSMCTILYIFKHAIYGLCVSSNMKYLLRKESNITALDDSLKKAIYYYSADTIYSNYLVKYKDGNPSYGFKIQNCQVDFTSFQLLLKEIHRKSSDTYTGEDPYFDFYGFFRKKERNEFEYVLAKENINSHLIYSPTKGFLRSKSVGAVLDRWNRAIVEMKLDNIEYPSVNL